MAPTKSTKTLRYGYLEIPRGWSNTKDAIEELEQKLPELDLFEIEKFDWDRAQNLKHQKRQIDRYNAILDANPLNLQALQGLNAVLRELNASSNQHSNTLITNTEDKADITPAEREAAEAGAKVMKLRLSKG